MKSLEERFWSKVDKSGPWCERLGSRCWVWTAGLDRKGYGTISIKGKNKLAHRVAWELAFGPLPPFTGLKDGIVVRHECDNTRCCNQEHLRTGTQADNVRDRVVRGRSCVGTEHWTNTSPEKLRRGATHPVNTGEQARPIGMRNPRAKLSEAQVKEIVVKLAAGGKQTALGLEYGVAHSTVGRIGRGEYWRHLTVSANC